LGPGVYPAAITPFDSAGAIDYPCVARLLAAFASRHCRGVVLAGTNGEGPSLSATEKRDLVATAAPIARELGIEIVLGIASSSLAEVEWLCRSAQMSGASAVLVMAPFYFREATDKGLLEWFRQVLDRSPLPVLVYNFPKRAGVTIRAEMLLTLGAHPNYLGVKDSSGSIENLTQFRDAAPHGLSYVGDETLLLQALKAGWTGSISGAANVLPSWLSQVVSEFSSDPESAEAKFGLILPGLIALRSAAQPAANKAILHRVGLIENASPRLPLLPLPIESADQLATTLQNLLI
jgi:4-hydroxy-tetrahydrodipicolinate synthase